MNDIIILLLQNQRRRKIKGYVHFEVEGQSGTFVLKFGITRFFRKFYCKVKTEICGFQCEIQRIDSGYKINLRDN